MRHLAAFLLAALIFAPGCGPADAAPPFTAGPPPTGAGTDTTAIHRATAGEIAAAASCTVASGDYFLGEDVSASHAKCRTTAGAIAALAAASGNQWDKTLAQCQAITPALNEQCHPTDSPYTLVSRVAGTWVYRYPGIGFDVTPPPSASWTAYNTGSVAVVGGTRVLTMPAETSAGGWRGEYRARPSDPTTTPYYVDMIFDVPWTGLASGNAGTGAMFSDGTGVAVGYTGGSVALQAIRYSNATTFAAIDCDVAGVGASLFGVRIQEDGTNRHFYVLDLQSGAATECGAGFGRTVTFTADKVGWASLGADAELARRVRLVHYATGTP